MKKVKQGKGGAKKIGRNKRPKCQATSNFVRNKITFEQYQKMKK